MSALPPIVAFPRPYMMEVTMRIAFAIILLAAAAPFDTAKSDPYRWCADYGGGGMGPGRNCYFITLEQCRWAISGNGGCCVLNPFYDGRPVVMPEDGVRVKRRPRNY